LSLLEPFADDAAFRAEWAKVKFSCKNNLAGMIQRITGIAVDPHSLFDVQVKRIHEYKRQHLNILHIITRYLRIKKGSESDAPPRTYIFGGKAAPGYAMAKLMIRLIHAVADVVNNDPEIGNLMKVVFYPDFNVKNAQWIYPAADVSEQISTAGKEASGTGNMKFSLNGALTVGTLDGANVEIREAVGPDNFFLFGLTADQILQMKKGGYRPRDFYETNPELLTVINMLASGVFSRETPRLFLPMVDTLVNKDDYMLMADYASYVKCQDAVGQQFLKPDQWHRMSILNVSRMGGFSSDRAIREYCRDIWKVEPVDVTI